MGVQVPNAFAKGHDHFKKIKNLSCFYPLETIILKKMENFLKNELNAIIPDEIRAYFDKIPDEVWSQSLTTLATLIRPTRQQRYVRVQFDREKQAAVAEKRQMDIKNIIGGVCSFPWLQEMISEPVKLVWMMTPLVPYDTQITEILDSSLEQLTRVLELPEYKPKWDKGEMVGEELDPRVVKLKMEVLKMLDQRKHGGYTQRTESKNLNANMNMNADEDDIASLSLEDIQKKIKRLESERGKNTNLIGYGNTVEDGASIHDVIEISNRNKEAANNE